MAARVFSRLSSTEAAPPWGLLTAINSIIIAYVMILMGTLIGAFVLGESPVALPISWLLGCVLIVGFVMISRRRSTGDWAALRLESEGRTLVFVALVSMGVVIALDVLSLGVTREFLPAPELFSLYQQQVSAPAWVAAFLLMVIAQPIGEEMIFRGVGLPALRATLGAWPGLLICALAYGIFHQLAYSSPTNNAALTWYGLVLPILAGLYLGGVRVYTGSTRAAIVGHMAMGVFAVLKALTLVS
jgi:membrane protease YdiL (CAAX protease family)